MIHLNFILNRIDITCDMVGGEDKLKESGLKSVMGYSKIIEELNLMKVSEVFYIIKELDSMGGVYKYFSDFIMKSEILDDRFFEINDMYEPKENNLNRMMEGETPDFHEDDLKKLKIDESKLEDIYKKHIQNTPKEVGDEKKIKEFVDKEYLYNFSIFKENLDFHILSWLETNLNKMTHEDFGMFMNLINKIRNNER